MTSVSWHSLARRELFEASDFYDAESVGLGNIFLDAVEHGVAVLKAQPGLGTPIRRETRWFVIARFPYSIVYRIDRGREGAKPASTFWRSLTREGAHCIGPAVVEVAARRTTS